MSELESVASNAAPDVAAPTPEAPAPEATTTPAAEADRPSASSREALQRAFDKLSESPEDQPRAADGKWTTRGSEKAADPGPAAVATAATQEAPAEAPAPATAKVEPPSRFAAPAKEAWAATPDPVKFEVERAFFEMEKGLKDYQARFEPLKQFDEMARAAGKQLPSVVAEYVNMENLLRQNPMQGFQLLAQRVGIDPRQLGEALANGTLPQAPSSQAQEADRLARLEQRLIETQKNIEESRTLAQIDQFAKDHPRFEELSDVMAEMLKTGFATDLPDAYAKAERLQPPAPQPQQAPTIAVPTAPQTSPAQTRPVVKQITGSPSGSNPSSRPPAGSNREALRSAFASVGLS